MQEQLASQPSAPDGDRGLIMTQISPVYTGTGLPEWIQYASNATSSQKNGTGRPLVVCWHGYGQSCQSPAIDSQVDEECAARHWIYLAITGAYQCNFGVPVAQIHCTKAIQYLIEELGLDVDVDRIYMIGLSMGGGAAASYATRHLRGCADGYSVAGLVLISASYDWVHAYYQNDPGVMYWMPYLLGGPPSQYYFEYRQVSNVSITFGHTYLINESMGQNLAMAIPVFLTYAGNDTLPYGVLHNEIMVQMLTDLGADLYVDYYEEFPDPHTWSLLDVPAAFSFLENRTLSEQNPEKIQVLADRDESYYWASEEQTEGGAFSILQAQCDSAQNKLTVSEASNTDTLTVDGAWTQLKDEGCLFVDYDSTSAVAQTLKINDIPTKPSYIVNSQGVLHPHYSYSAGQQQINIGTDPHPSLDLKASFEPYNLTLSAVQFAQLDQTIPINLSGGAPYDNYLIMFGLDQVETAVGPHHILISPLFPTIFLISALDGSGSASFQLTVPHDLNLLGVTFYQQFITFGTSIKEISNLASTTIQV